MKYKPQKNEVNSKVLNSIRITRVQEIDSLSK